MPLPLFFLYKRVDSMPFVQSSQRVKEVDVGGVKVCGVQMVLCNWKWVMNRK